MAGLVTSFTQAPVMHMLIDSSWSYSYLLFPGRRKPRCYLVTSGGAGTYMGIRNSYMIRVRTWVVASRVQTRSRPGSLSRKGVPRGLS